MGRGKVGGVVGRGPTGSMRLRRADGRTDAAMGPGSDALALSDRQALDYYTFTGSPASHLPSPPSPLGSPGVRVGAARPLQGLAVTIGVCEHVVSLRCIAADAAQPVQPYVRVVLRSPSRHHCTSANARAQAGLRQGHTASCGCLSATNRGCPCVN